MWPFESIIQNYKDKQRQKENESIAQSILQHTASNKHPELGTPIDKPIIDEHPELDIALFAAQPGSIVTKAMAPDVYKSMVNSLINGEGAQSIMQGIIPAGSIKGATATMFKDTKAGWGNKWTYEQLLSKLEQIPEDKMSKSLIKDIKNFYKACNVSTKNMNRPTAMLYERYAKEAGQKAINEAENVLADIKLKTKNAATQKQQQQLYSITKHDPKLQAIIDSDFVPFDETKTLFQTGSKAKTTMDFRLSDYYKQGGTIKSIF